MDLQILEIVKNLPIFCENAQELIKVAPSVERENIEEPQEKKHTVSQREIEIIPLIEGKTSKFLINHGQGKYLLNIASMDAKRELDVWLKMTEKGLSIYRPDIYYIDPSFLFTISQFYEGYTRIDKMNLSLVDKEIISRHLLQFNKDFHKITSNEFHLKAIMQNAFADEIAIFRKEDTLSEEEASTILSFVDHTDFGNVATYNHQSLSMENILYNQETKDLKVVHMKQAKYGVPIYDYVYMFKTIDKEISQVFLPLIKEADPKVVQAISLLCDMKIYHKNKGKKENVQMDLENIHTQISVLKEQISSFKR